MKEEDKVIRKCPCCNSNSTIHFKTSDAKMLEKRVKELETELADLKQYTRGALIPAEVFGPDDICDKCSGWGFRDYPSTAVWTGGIGGQAITNGVCDVCWGSGQKSRKGADLRKLSTEHKEMREQVEHWRSQVEELTAERNALLRELTLPVNVEKLAERIAEENDNIGGVLALSLEKLESIIRTHLSDAGERIKELEAENERLKENEIGAATHANTWRKIAIDVLGYSEALGQFERITGVRLISEVMNSEGEIRMLKQDEGEII